MVISDCCCHVANAIHDVFPEAVVCLDAWHLLIRYAVSCHTMYSLLLTVHLRYLICVAGGSKSSVRADVTCDIVESMSKCRAIRNTPATYWTEEEQETRFVAAFKKWNERGVWAAAGVKVRYGFKEEFQLIF